MKKFAFSFLCFAAIGMSASAQTQKGYTNFNDTVISIKEVTVIGYDQSKTRALKLDVPSRFLPIATSSLPSLILVERDVQDIQEAVKFIPGVRIKQLTELFNRFLHVVLIIP